MTQHKSLLEKSLVSLGILKIFLVFAFFASLTVFDPRSAEATEDESCTGMNLLAHLEETDPLAYRQVVAQAEQIINSNSVFWKIEKDGLAPSYLFGTMHLSDPAISTLSNDVKTALSQSKTLVVESTDALDPSKAQAAMSQLGHLALLSDGTLRDRIDDDLEDELETAVSARGIPMFLANRMQPWVIATTIALPICEIERKKNGELVLDSVLAKQAEENGMAIKGLESVEEQLTAIATLPENYHVAALEETLAAGQITTDMLHTMKDIYKDGNIGLIFPLMKAVLPKAGSGEGSAEFQEALIEKRNINMAERVAPILQDGSVFIAVGALHLPDETGLVNLLRKQGYTITSVR